MSKKNICRNGHSNAFFTDAHDRRDCKICSRERIRRFTERKFFGGNRELVIRRDKEECVNCGMGRQEHKNKYGMDITVDHIDGTGINTPVGQKNNAPDNLQTLCLACHGSKDCKRYLESVV